MDDFGEYFNESKPKVKVRKAVNVINPTKFDDVQSLIARFKQKEGLIVDFDQIPIETTQRMLDFLAGAVYALDGNINKIKNGIYILIPKGIKISTVKR